MSHLFSYNLHYRLAMYPNSEKENDMKAQIFHCHTESESNDLPNNLHFGSKEQRDVFCLCTCSYIRKIDSKVEFLL